jgi:hypothetical protein
MTKKEMLALVAQRFGREHEYTLQFEEVMIEGLGQVELEALLYEVLALPLDLEDEEWD